MAVYSFPSIARVVIVLLFRLKGKKEETPKNGLLLGYL
jgi:hypothetical protein